MRERAVRFGMGSALAGVLAEPDQMAAGAPGVVFLNSGILHHVGACRLHVRLARKLAESGIASLRFDFSGIGDSEARKDSLHFAESAPVEVRDAMDYLGKGRPIDRFIVLGLCSGADMAFAAARTDPRIVGLGQLDGYAYRNFGYYLRYYWPRVTSLTTWRRFLARKLQPSTGGPISQSGLTSDYVRPEYRRRFPPQSEVAEGLRELLARDVELLFIFSGGQPDHYNHRDQYRASFRGVPFGDRLEVHYMGDADHLFSGLGHQDAVDGIIHDWVLRISGVPEGGVEPPAGVPAIDGTVTVARLPAAVG